MAGAKFEYDESGGTFFSFLLSFLALILLPCTYYFWPFNKDDQEESSKGSNCLCVPCMKKKNRTKTENKKSSGKAIRVVVLLIGWLAFAALVYKVSTIEREVTIFDPYEVLSLDKSSSMAEIRKAYRKLSLQYHPDKPTGDHAMFMKIAKSYQALTDEASRKNWEEFGSPDGPQAASFGIALPSWIVDKDNSLLVLGVYLLAFVVVLPVCVGTWWYRSIKYTSDEILVDTTRLYYHFLMHASLFPIKRAITVLSASLEFEPTMNQKVAIRPSDNTELPELIRKLPDVVVEGKQMPFNMPYSVKARLLVGAHLERLELPPSTLEVDRARIVAYCPRLIQEIITCMSQVISYYHQMQQKGHRGPTLDAVENCMRLSSILVQAVKDYHNPLLQLPHFSSDHLRFMRTKKRAVRSLIQLAELTEKERREMLRHFDGQEYCDIMNVLASIPYVKLDSEAEVKDDIDPTCITAGSLITVSTGICRSTIGEHFKLLSVDELVAAYESHGSHGDSGSAGSSPSAVCGDGDFDAECDGEDGEEDADKPAKVSQWQKKPAKKPAKKSKQQSKGDRRKKMKELAQQKQKEEEEEQQQALQSARRAEQRGSDGSDDDDDNDSDDNDDDNSEEGTGAASDQASPRAANNLVARRRKGGKKGGRRRASGSESDGESDGGNGNNGDGGARNSDDDEEEEWKLLQKERGDEMRLDAQKKLSPEVHAPYYPETKHEKWWLYVCDRRKKELLSVPQLISTLRDNEEVKTAIPAPSKPGILHYTVVLRSDSYLDAEYTYNLKIEVHEAKEMETTQAQWKDLEGDGDESEELLQMSSDDGDMYSDDDGDDED